MASYLEIRANCILKRVLKDSVDHGIEIPDDVPLWIERYHEVCDDGTSEQAQTAVADARNVMEKLYKAITDHPIQELQCMVLGWRQEAGDPRTQQKMCARAPAALSEANVEAHEFRLELAKETLQSFKRGRSRSPRPSVAPDTTIETMRAMISALKASISTLKETVQLKDQLIQVKDIELDKIRRDRSRSPLRFGPLSNAARAALDVVCRHDTGARVEDQRATIAGLRQELAAKDVEIADLRDGKGAIGPILASHMSCDNAISRHTMEMTETVAEFVDRVRWLAHCVTENLAWGRHNPNMARNASNES